jgi:hypothetical protein
MRQEMASKGLSEVLAIFALLDSPGRWLSQWLWSDRPVPANLLRFSIVFSSALSNVGVQDFALRQASGSQILAPFDPRGALVA